MLAVPGGGAFVFAASSDSIARVNLHEVEVNAKPLAISGMTRVSIDSMALRRNPSLSLADVVALQPSVFVKTSGRATLSTVALRGAGPSHTLVEWNGLNVNSPMLGMTDFSLIPAWLIDRGEVIYGSSSIEAGAGGIGGAVKLNSSTTDLPDGLSCRFISGFGSFLAFDEFLSAGYRSERFATETRVAFSTARNDFSYINHNKKLNIYDDAHNIIGQYYPRERNVNGAYRDLHLLEQLSFSIDSHNRLELDAWWLNSRRELPLTTVNYSPTDRYENLQHENTLRSSLRWLHSARRWRSTAALGVIASGAKYLYGLDNGSGLFNRLTDAHTHITSLSANYKADLMPDPRSSVTVEVAGGFDKVDSRDLASLSGDLGYRKSRFNGSLSATWRSRLASTTSVVVSAREELHGTRATLPIVALRFQQQLCDRWGLNLNASGSRNETVPTLNDLYYVPGGNPDLKPEKAWSYDLGLEASRSLSSLFSLSATATFHDSYITDWIMWLPTTKGFFSPQNVKNVHAYGVELTLAPAFYFNTASCLKSKLGYSFTPSINTTLPDNPLDQSYRKQLPYIPRHTFSFSLDYNFRRWNFSLTGLYYSRRFTTTSNQPTATGSVSPYFIADATIERTFPLRATRNSAVRRSASSTADSDASTQSVPTLSVKIALNNLFNADYVTILTHPMPGFNFAAYVALSF